MYFWNNNMSVLLIKYIHFLFVLTRFETVLENYISYIGMLEIVNNTKRSEKMTIVD